MGYASGTDAHVQVALDIVFSLQCLPVLPKIHETVRNNVLCGIGVVDVGKGNILETAPALEKKSPESFRCQLHDSLL